MGEQQAVGSTSMRPDAAFVVIVADPMTGDVDAFGPFDETEARADVVRRRIELDAEHLDDVLVASVPLTPPGEDRTR